MLIPLKEYDDYINNLTNYETTDEDDDLLTILETQEVQHMLNVTNQTTLPTALYPALKMRVVGTFLSIRKKAILGDANVQMVTSINEGDVKFNIKGDSDEDRLNAIIAELSQAGDLACFRQFRW